MMLFKLPDNAPRKAAENGPSIWVSAAYVGDSDGGPGSCLLADLAIAGVDI